MLILFLIDALQISVAPGRSPAPTDHDAPISGVRQAIGRAFADGAVRREEKGWIRNLRARQGRTVKRAGTISLPRRAGPAAKGLQRRGHRIGSIGHSSAAMLVVDRDTGVIHAAGESAAGAPP